MALPDSLLRAQKRLRRSVAPHANDAQVDMAEVWRMPDTDVGGVAGGGGTDDYGFPVSGTGDAARPDQQRVNVATYPCRIVKNSGRELEFGTQTTPVGDWLLLFNWDDDPDIRGGDRLLIALTERIDGERRRVVWQPKKVYLTGDVVQPTVSNGRFYRATATTRTGETEPAWPRATVGDTVTDGGIIWTYGGALRTFEVSDPGGETTFAVSRLVGCKEIGTWKGYDG